MTVLSYSLLPLDKVDIALLEVGRNCFLRSDLLQELLELNSEYKYYALLHENNFLMTMIKTDLGFVSNLPISGGAFNYFLDRICECDVNNLSFYYYGACGGQGDPYFSKKVEDYSYMVYVSRETSHFLARTLGMNLLSKEDYRLCALATSNGYSWDINRFASAPNGFYVPNKKEWTLDGMYYNPMTLGYLADFGLQGFEHAYVRLFLENSQIGEELDRIIRTTPIEGGSSANPNRAGLKCQDNGKASQMKKLDSLVNQQLPPLPEIPVYVAVNGQQAGPFNMSSLHQMVRLGQLTLYSLVWMQGMDNWEAASTVAYIAPVFNAVPPLDDKLPHID
jgi:hypothetical protein